MIPAPPVWSRLWVEPLNDNWQVVMGGIRNANALETC